MSRPASPVKCTINDAQYRIWVPTILKVLVTSSTTVLSTNGTNVQRFAGTTPLEVFRIHAAVHHWQISRPVNALVIPSFSPDQLLMDNVTVSFS